MGVALFQRDRDEQIFAIISRKEGPSGAYLATYRLTLNKNGKVDAAEITRLGAFSGKGEIEALGVDNGTGLLFSCDEDCCIRVYRADPQELKGTREMGTFGSEGYSGDREGVGVYALPHGEGYVLSTDQIKGDSVFTIYDRKAVTTISSKPVDALATFRGGADDTDGLEVTSRSLGSRFPCGVVVAMNSTGRNFFIYDWRDIAKAGSLKSSNGR